uniref:Double-strand break repair protein n=1 Tax=Timema douglasi TaxID=61478 RepID=A0A7R8VE45_TIMDO|nr:unnamed protein product [Timema douglasi]
MGSNAPAQDVFNILLATDIHLGYAEKEAERADDSFNTFEEILRIAVERKVDFILLGGDLFHDHRPSQTCLFRCMSLIRQYCMGDRPVSVEFLSDQSVNFQHCKNPVVNYEDPNLNISIPIFSINGNHDDCSAMEVSAMDVLASTGLVNYFAKWDDFQKVDVSPLLIQKGKTRLAIFGLSYMKDERLSRLFRNGKVQLFRPKEDKESWFNLMVLHQNRADHGVYTYIPEEALDDFLDLVMWGHEHECRISPEWNPSQSFYVTQPGSSVATSLSKGETAEKHVGLLQVHKKEFKLEAIKLQTVEQYVAAHVEKLIEQSRSQLTGHKLQPKEPLIRIRVEYKEEWQIFNSSIFGQQFINRVANFKDIILLRLEYSTEKKKKFDDGLDMGVMEFILRQEDMQSSEGTSVEKVVEKYFENTEEDRQLKVHSVKGLGAAIQKLLDYGDERALDNLVDHQIKKLKGHLFKNVTESLNTVVDEIERFRVERMNKAEEEAKEDREFLDRDAEKRGTGISQMETTDIKNDDFSSDDDDSVYLNSTMTNRTRGGRGARGARGVRGKGAAPKETSDSPGHSRGGASPRRARGRGSRGARASSRAATSLSPFLSKLMPTHLL